MAEQSVPEALWGAIAAQVANQLGLTTHRSPTLSRSIELGVRYAKADPGVNQLVFDTRAFFAGLLLTGLQPIDTIRYGNSAIWLVDWLRSKIGDKGISEAMARLTETPVEEVQRLLDRKAEIVLSSSMIDICDRAAGYSNKTIARPEFEARHVLAAMFDKGAVQDQTRLLFGIDLNETDLTALKTTFLDRLLETAAKDEQRLPWESVLHLRPPTPTRSSGISPTSEGDPQRPVDTVTVFGRDSVAAADGSDPLDTASDARALARLMCLKDAAPLAIAIFGGWGSGKSTFMDRLDREVRTIAAAAPSPTDPARPRFVERVVQIRFNAWQFVDANLWASLAAEFFEQLRAGGWNSVGATRHAELVERVNSHVPALNADAEAKRQAAAESGSALARARAAHAQAASAAAQAPLQAIGERAAAEFRSVFEAQKGNLSRLGLLADAGDTGEAVEAIVDAAQTSLSALGQLRAVGRVVARSGRGTLTVAIAAAVLVASMAGLWLGLADSDGVSPQPWAMLVTALTALGAAGAAAQQLLPAIRLVRDVAKRVSDMAEEVDNANDATAKALLKAELDLQQASADASQKQAAADAASRAQLRYAGPDGATGQPRLLRYVLEKDPSTKAIAAEVGVIGRARRLFQAVDDIVREEGRKPAGTQLDGDVPERIILYIDDLDRCSPAQVYDVLQAVHLLLAFDLFVVVVGVDVAWVQDALARAFGDKEGDSVTSRQRAARYLDKIFQIAFWLSPLSSDGEKGGSFARYIRQLSEPGVPSADPATRTVAAPAAVLPAGLRSGNAAFVEPTTGISGKRDVTLPEPAAAPAPAAQQPLPPPAPLTSIQLKPVEIDFLASPVVATVAASTPRSVKRLLNVYRLVRTRLAESGAQDPVDGGGGPPDYPLIGLMVAIETGQTVEVADALFAGLKGLLPDEALLSPRILDGAEKEHSLAVAVLEKLWTEQPRLKAGFEAVAELRGQRLTASEVLRVARLARRYSFNRYS